jgi:hypothetical protein
MVLGPFTGLVFGGGSIAATFVLIGAGEDES